jgi:formylglycine-generating enzyme required for sulfatase activity
MKHIIRHIQQKLYNPKGPSNGSYRVIRGGSWYSDVRYLRSAKRYYAPPGGRGDGLGLRLVRIKK